MASRRETALRLRLEGKSYSEIQKALGKVSKSTLSLWLRDIVLSESARVRIEQRSTKSLIGLLRRNRAQTHLARSRAKTTEQRAAIAIGKLTPEQIFFIGIALYWAEGYKRPLVRKGRTITSHYVSLTNSDPLLVKCFLEFLKLCKVLEEKIRADLRVFEHTNQSQVLNFWVGATGIPEAQFTVRRVGISKSSMNKRPFNRLPYGVVQIRINDTQLFYRIIGWINGVKKQLPR